MTDASKPEPGTEEGQVQQDPLTVLPIAAILMMVELLEVLKTELPQVNEKLMARLELLKARDIGKAHPKSMQLFEAVLKEGSGE